jgi:MoxR-like ATPase
MSPLNFDVPEADVNDVFVPSEPTGWKPPMPECWKVAEDIISAGVPRVLLIGIPGTGKSYAARHFGLRQGQEVVNIYVREDSAEYQVVGTDIFQKDGSSGWRNGPALIAMQRGWRLVVNEIDHASGDVADAFMGIADDPRSAGWMLPTGEYVQPAPGFQAIFTMNAEREDLVPALADRLIMTVRITHPHPSAVMDLPEHMRKVAWQLSHEGVDEAQRVSIRAFREYARALDLGVKPHYAALAAFHHRAEELVNAMDLATQDEPDDEPVYEEM